MTFKELQDEVIARLSINTTNEFWTVDMIKNWLNQANRWACTYKFWPFTEKAKYTLSRANALYYDYPESFRSDSIRLLQIEQDDGTMADYQKVRYEDFMKYILDNPDGTDKIFSDFKRQFFINPKVPVDGKQICVWGQEKPALLVNDNDTTPFSEGDEAGEEAIIKRAVMIALQKARRYQEAAVERDEARLILEDCWARIQEEQAGYQSKDRSFFETPDYFK